MIWILIALIASLVALALVLPVMRRAPEAAASGLTVFSGQLEELRRDADLGLIEPEDARAAELDIRRRAKAAENLQPEDGDSGTPSPRLRLAIIAASTLSVMAAVLIYMQIGSPHLTGQPPVPASQMPEDMQAVLDEVDALAADLMANPDNPRGWAVLGQAYVTLGRYQEAAVAFENAIDRVPDSAFLFASLGQAYLFAADGDMTPPAREAFARALDIDPQDVRARFFMAEALWQDGEREAALAAWQRMLDEAPDDAGYTQMVEARMAEARNSEPAD
ncbi:MAG: c-type cytochrome biogenesis protein CcmI [Pseudomonadota bacterium]|nr:c-type cytochrome biogenesis protein CcmI [Pseudomonadota bacterium]